MESSSARNYLRRQREICSGQIEKPAHTAFIVQKKTWKEGQPAGKKTAMEVDPSLFSQYTSIQHEHIVFVCGNKKACE